MNTKTLITKCNSCMEVNFDFLIQKYGFIFLHKEETNNGFNLIYVNINLKLTIDLLYDYKEIFLYFAVILNFVAKKADDLNSPFGSNKRPFYTLIDLEKNGINIQDLQPTSYEDCSRAVEINSLVLKLFLEKRECKEREW